MTLIDMAALPVRDWTANANCSRHPGYHVTHCHRFNQEYELRCVLCETEDEEYEPDEELELDSAFSQEVSKLQMLSERLSKKISLLGASLRCPHQKEQLKRHITDTFKTFDQKVQEKYQELKKHTTNGDFASDAEMQVKLKEARDYATKLFNTSNHDFLSLVPKVQRRIDSLMTTINNPIATHTMSARNCYILEQRCERLQITIKCFGELASKSTSKVRRQMRPPIAYAKRMHYHTNTYHPIKFQRYNPKKKVDNNMRTASGGRKPYESALLNRKPLYPVQTKPRFVSKPPKETYSLDPSSLYRDRTKPRLSSKASMLTNRKPLYPYQNKARPDVKTYKENVSMVSKGAQRNQPKTQASSRKSRENPKPLQTTSQNAPKKPKGNSVKGPKEIQLYDIKVQLPPKKQVAISMKQSRKSTNKPEDTSSAALLNRARSKLDKHRTQPERHLPTPECLRPPNRISGLSKHNKPDTLTNRTPKANKKQGTAKSRSKESTDAFHDQLERMRASNYQTGTQKNDNNEWIFKTKSGGPSRSSDKKAKQAGKKDDAASKRILPLKSRRVLIPGSPPGSTCNDDLLFDGNGDAVLGQLVMKQPGVAHSETKDPKRQEQLETKDENFTLRSQSPSVGKNIESQDMISDYDPAMDNDETDSLEMVLEEEKSIDFLTNPTKDEQVLFQKELQLTGHQYPDDSNLIPENANTPSNQMPENAEMENNYSKDNFNDTLERIKSEIEKMCFTEKDTDVDTSKETKNEKLVSKHDSNVETFDGQYNDSQFATYDNNNFDSNFEIPEMENQSLPYFDNKHPDSPIETHENINSEKHESKHIDSKFKTKEKNDMVSEFDISKKTHPEGQFETLDKKNLDSLFEHPKTKDVDTHKETTKSAVDLDIIYDDEKVNNDYISKTDTPVHATDVDLQSQTHIAKPKEIKDEWRNSSKDNMNNSQLAYTSNDDSLVNDNDAQDNKVDEYTWNNKDYETKSTDRIPNKDQNRKESNNLDFRTQTADAWIYDNKESTHTQNRKASKPMDNDIVYVQGKNVSVIMYESPDICGHDTYAVSANTEPKTDNVHLNQTPDSEALVGLNSDTVTHDLDQIQDTHIYPHVGSKYRPQEPDLLSCNVYSEVDTLYNRDLGLHANKIREVYADEMKTDEKKDKDKLHPKSLVTDKQEESRPSESHLTNENPHESVSRDDDVAPRLVDNKQTESKPIVNDMLTANREGSFEKNVYANDIPEAKQNKYIPTEKENASLHTHEANGFSKQANIDTQIKLQDDRNTQKLQVPIIQDDINSQTKWPYSPEKDKLELQTKSQVPYESDDIDLQGKALKSRDKELESQTKSEVATQQNDMDSQRKTLKSQDKEELESQTKSEVATQQNDIDSQTKSLESPEKEHLGSLLKPQADTDSNAESQVSPEKASNIGSNRDKLDSKSEKESQVSPEQNDIQEDISKTEGDANATEEQNNVSFTPEAGDEVDKSQKMDKDDHLVLTVVQNAVTGSSSEIARVKVLNQDMTPEKHGELKATVHGPNGLEAAVEVEKVKDWSTTYRLVYCPQVAGVHTLQLVFQGKGVSDQTEFTSSDEGNYVLFVGIISMLVVFICCCCLLFVWGFVCRFFCVLWGFFGVFFCFCFFVLFCGEGRFACFCL